LYDHGAQAFGRDPATGFALRPLDNVGVQYGLQTLNERRITKAQFLELNEKIGGVDIDANFTRERTTGDRAAAIRRGYETGRFLSGGGGLASMPIIDIRAYLDSNPGDPHVRVYSFVTRERLRKVNGHVDNHVMLAASRGDDAFEGPLSREGIRQMDRWRANLAKDTSSAPRAVKVVRARPARASHQMAEPLSSCRRTTAPASATSTSRRMVRHTRSRGCR
jgi:hypothetical protein